MSLHIKKSKVCREASSLLKPDDQALQSQNENMSTWGSCKYSDHWFDLSTLLKNELVFDGIAEDGIGKSLTS